MRMKELLKKCCSAAAVLTVFASLAIPRVMAQTGAIKVAPEVMEKSCIKKVTPIFPQILRQSRMQGAVIVHVLISKTGMVTPLDVVSGPPLFQDAAKSTVRKWEYRPYTVKSQPVAVSTEVTVVFKLDNPEGVVTHPNQ